MKKNGMRKLLVLLMALVFAFSLSGCGETATLLSLYEDMNELGIYELNDNIRLDISMSEEALDTMDDEAKDILEKILPLLEDFSVKGVIDTEKMILDLEMVYQADGGEKPFADLMLNVPDREFFIDLTGALDWMRTWQKDFVAEMESDLDGKKWLRFELDEEWARMAESMTSDYLPLNGQGTYSAVLNTLASEYLAGLEDTVFDEFDSGLAKKINGGVEFRITYEQTAAYIE
ncbi:MAG: hypothetical protein LBH21_06515, partial [Gracilibacteraceae bacterium]|nr:hypothetical protein [Gracilibacteraceae bacterium]